MSSMKVLTSFHWLKLANSPSCATTAFLALDLPGLLCELFLVCFVLFVDDSACAVSGARASRQDIKIAGKGADRQDKRRQEVIGMGQAQGQGNRNAGHVSWLTGKWASIHDELPARACSMSAILLAGEAVMRNGLDVH